jgi:hypothetical protein
LHTPDSGSGISLHNIRIYDAEPEQTTEAFESMAGTEPLCPTA